MQRSEYSNNNKTQARARRQGSPYPHTTSPYHDLRQLLTLTPMARQQSIYGRAARRAALAISKLPPSKGRGTPHADDLRFLCPYCGKKVQSDSGRYHHVILRPSCLARHLKQVKKRKRESTSTPETTLEEPLKKQARTDEEDTPGAGPSRLPIPGPSAVKLPTEGEGLERINDGLFTERFPVSTAGAPIGTRRTKQRDLKKYLKDCGRLGDHELFDTAEIMMGTGLSGRGRNRHLKAPAVSTLDKENAHYSQSK